MHEAFGVSGVGSLENARTLATLIRQHERWVGSVADFPHPPRTLAANAAALALVSIGALGVAIIACSALSGWRTGRGRPQLVLGYAAVRINSWATI